MSVIFFRFLPRLARTALDEELELLDVHKPPPPKTEDEIDRALTCEFHAIFAMISSVSVMLAIMYHYILNVQGKTSKNMH